MIIDAKKHRKSIFLVCWLCSFFIVVVKHSQTNIDAHKSKSMTKTDLLFYSVHELLGLIRLLGCNDNLKKKKTEKNNMNKFAWAHISTYIFFSSFACWIPSNVEDIHNFFVHRPNVFVSLSHMRFVRIYMLTFWE